MNEKNLSNFLGQFAKDSDGGYAVAKVLTALRDGSFERGLQEVIEAEREDVRKWEFSEHRVEVMRDAVRAELLEEMRKDGSIEIDAVVRFVPMMGAYA